MPVSSYTPVAIHLKTFQMKNKKDIILHDVTLYIVYVGSKISAPSKQLPASHLMLFIAVFHWLCVQLKTFQRVLKVLKVQLPHLEQNTVISLS